jgi:hypothetical protein
MKHEQGLDALQWSSTVNNEASEVNGAFSMTLQAYKTGYPSAARCIMHRHSNDLCYNFFDCTVTPSDPAIITAVAMSRKRP